MAKVSMMYRRMSPDVIKEKDRIYGEEFNAKKEKFDSQYLLPNLNILSGHSIYLRSCKTIKPDKPFK
jgi:hypothetical protein